MKKTTIWMLGILTFILILFCIISFPPGNEQWPLFVPRADRSNVGQTQTFSAERMLANGQNCFVYVYDPKTDTGRLGIFGGDMKDMTVFPLLICEPQWRGGEALCEAMKDEFSAKVMEKAHIGFVEGMHIYNTLYLQNDPLTAYKPHEVIAFEPFTGMDGDNLQYYFGYLSNNAEGENWNPISDRISIRIVAGTEATASEALLSKIEKLQRTAARYFLKDDFGI